jgi:superfamily II DNA or RNA helicase
MINTTQFPKEFSLSGQLRLSQLEASKVLKQRLAMGDRKLHVVAPPGSGKTVLGLHVWSELVKKPAVVLSPTSAIQSQWMERARDLFHYTPPEQEEESAPSFGWLTSLTYQSVTMPNAKDAELLELTLQLWVDDLLKKGEAGEEIEARIYIDDLRFSNLAAYENRISFYMKKARTRVTDGGDVLSVLSESARFRIQGMKDAGVGLIILDECHHLMHHWGIVLDEITKALDEPIVLGLTATPPEGTEADAEGFTRYFNYFGEVDYEVPVPALVRNKNLAPYQDLVYFSRPTPEEMEYIAGSSEQFQQLVEQITNGPNQKSSGSQLPGLKSWLIHTLDTLMLPTGPAENWFKFERRDPALAMHARLYFALHGIPLPEGIPELDPALVSEWNADDMELIIPLLDRYVRHGLMRSEDERDHALAERAKKQLNLFGVQITATGARACASPITRVLAYSEAKRIGAVNILEAEMDALGDDIRAVVVTDFERTSSNALIENLLDDEAGGAIAVFKHLLTSEKVDLLDPIMMTGSNLLMDDELLEIVLPELKKWVEKENLKIEFKTTEHDGFYRLKGVGVDWKPRNYVRMFTEMFQRGLTKCIVGTRGLLGEGWDASKINVLIDLTMVTSSMSINQLRGRSFRLDKDDPRKVANNWDVICLLPESKLGRSDFKRFQRKHANLYGVCDDKAIEKGPGHVHPGLSKKNAYDIIGDSMAVMNEEMLERATQRGRTRNLWQIGKPFNLQEKQGIEIKGGGEDEIEFKPHAPRQEWKESALVMAIGKAVAEGLKEAGLIQNTASIEGGKRGGAWTRLFLDSATSEEETLFVDSMKEILAPLENPRYIITRTARYFEVEYEHSLLTKVLPFVFKPSERHKSKDQIVMWHAVPKALARDKASVQRFLKLWTKYVCRTSEIVYAKSKSGRERVQQAIEAGLSPRVEVNKKSVFT